MNALGYSRISTEKQSEYSLDYQERLIREAAERNKLNLLATFKDDGESSYTFDRPNWLALEAFIKKNKNVDYLIVVDLDRFSRNLAEALMKITELQAKYKIKVITASDSLDADFMDPSNFMIRAFKLMMAESELHNIRKRTKNGVIQSRLEGRLSNMAPYGYSNARDSQDKPILLIVDNKADIVRMIFREYLSGMEIIAIYRQAVAAGFRQTGKGAIKRILGNQVYTGMVPVPPHKGRKKPWVPGLHAPIISEQDFWIAQERLGGGKKKAVHSHKEVPLRGALYCWCGRKVTAGNSRSKTGKYHWYYLCPEHRKNLPAVKLHLQFDELLTHMSLPEEKLAWLREKLMADIGLRIQDQGKILAQLQTDLLNCQRQRKAAERRALTMGNISENTLSEVMAEFNMTEARLQKEIAAAGSNHGAYLDRLLSLLPQLSRLRESFHKLPTEKQQQFINLGFDNSLSHDGTTYRTRALHPLLSDKELILKEKGLLIIERPVILLGKIPSVPGTGAVSNFWDKSIELLELIA